MKTINANILQFTDGVICHQVNCCKVAGAGLALQIRNQYPGWYNEFLKDTPLLGRAWLYKASDKLFIASIYGQKDYGRDHQYTNYMAVDTALRVLSVIVPAGLQVYFPYNMGAGLAGGNWMIIRDMIYKYFPDCTVCKL